MRYYFDTEFVEDGRTIGLISIGIVAEDGRELYLENADCDLSRANDWVKANVLPHLRGGDCRLPRDDIRRIISGAFVGTKETNFNGHGKPEFWAYYSSYDWVALCQLFGRMIDLPDGWPMMPMDIKQLCVSLGDPKLPEQKTAKHDALSDAHWAREAWLFLQFPTDIAGQSHLIPLDMRQ
jgi:hypothetical protein